jgi:hypothetical protein
MVKMLRNMYDACVNPLVFDLVRYVFFKDGKDLPGFYM